MRVRTRRRTRPALDRLMEKVEIVPSGCWEWRAYIKPNGYGDFRYEGGRWAHRASYELHVGPIPDGLTLDHLCRNKSCVNPEHLEPIPGPENTRRSARPWTSCAHRHPGEPPRWGKRGRGGSYCKECQRVKERERRAQLAEEHERTARRA
jgi:hypothetical protein